MNEHLMWFSSLVALDLMIERIWNKNEMNGSKHTVSVMNLRLDYEITRVTE